MAYGPKQTLEEGYNKFVTKKEIMKKGLSQKKLAEKFGLSKSLISLININENYFIA